MQESDDLFDPERRAILEAALPLAVFEGFTPLMLREAASAAGLSPSVLAAAFPGGARDLLAFWSAEADRAAAASLAAPEAGALRIREKVARAVEARIAYLEPHKEAARRAAAMLALPTHASLGAKLVWRTADAIWRALGDRSTDFNFYSKRAILGSVVTSTMARWFADDDPDAAATRAFLADRIENVMQFEKLKTEWRKVGVDPEGIWGWLAKARYPSRKS